MDSSERPVSWLSSGLLRVLRLEGLAVAGLSAILYQRTGASWWLFAALWLLPDLSILGYVWGSRSGALSYNVIHSNIGPSALVCGALLLGTPALLPYGLIWFNHIGVDRMLGYGLKSVLGFGFTHLKRVGPNMQGSK